MLAAKQGAKHFHLIGVSGTGMGGLAGLLAEKGYRVSGSDTAFYPPIGTALEGWGVVTKSGWDANNITSELDVVVVGNVCRRDNIEARRALELGLETLSLPDVMRREFLSDRRVLALCGTHGKTTSSAMLAHILSASGKAPSALIGGLVQGLNKGFALDNGPDFVIEGDEYDSAYFQKSPKFWHYNVHSAVVTGIEFDHVDIYPDIAAYEDAFIGLIKRLPTAGTLAYWGADPRASALCPETDARAVTYGLGEDGDGAFEWRADFAGSQEGYTTFDLFLGGTSAGRARLSAAGKHNVRNALGALILAVEVAGVTLRDALKTLESFRGVKRRQEKLGVAGGVTIIDDFAHHPTAIFETLAALKTFYAVPGQNPGRLIALFEPRSATACRNIHQHTLAESFRLADLVLLAPVGRPEIPPDEALDLSRVRDEIIAASGEAHLFGDHDAIVNYCKKELRAGDTLVIMSNGAFGGIHRRVFKELDDG